MNFANIANNKTFGTFTTSGPNDYCFSTSTILDKELYDTFSRNSVFRIKDPVNFILEVTRVLPRVQEVLFGNCIYLKNRILKKDLPDIKFEDFLDKNNNVVVEKTMAASSLVNGPDSNFIKEDKYQKQSEFRIIWRTDRIIENGIIINCPEATKYCEIISSEKL